MLLIKTCLKDNMELLKIIASIAKQFPSIIRFNSVINLILQNNYQQDDEPDKQIAPPYTTFPQKQPDYNQYQRYPQAYTGSKYDVIAEVASKMSLHIAQEMYNLLWTDYPLTIRDIKNEPQETRVNHIPQITQITRKNKMASNLNTMRIHFPKDYNFYPETWILPSDFQKMTKKHMKGKVYIVKPQNGCQGQGIYLANNPFRLQKQRNAIVQEYIMNPMLINQLKFDLRIYVLVTCVSPLRIYLYNDGIVRFATEKFQKPNEDNMTNYYSHLTNYAINKQNEKFTVDEKNINSGHKRLVTSLFRNEDYKELMKQISEIVVKTVISGLPYMQNAYGQCKRNDPSSCFQLLGFDILLTDRSEPILLQVNQNASLSTETGFDHRLKFDLVRNILEMMTGGYSNMFEEKMESKIRLKDRHQHAYRGNFSKIYPCDSLQQTESYDQFIVKANAIYRDRFGISIVRNVRKSRESYREQQEMVAWNEQPLRYTQDKVERVYGVRMQKTSVYKKRLIFI